MTCPGIFKVIRVIDTMATDKDIALACGNCGIVIYTPHNNSENMCCVQLCEFYNVLQIFQVQVLNHFRVGACIHVPTI